MNGRAPPRSEQIGHRRVQTLELRVRAASTPNDHFPTLVVELAAARIAGLASKERGPEQRTELLLPSGATLELSLIEGDHAPRYAVDIGVDSVDLVVEMTLLRRGFTVFDFASRRTWFAPYGVAAV